MTKNSTESHQVKSHAYWVIEGKHKGQPAYWHRIGTSFAHEDGKGETIILYSLPLAFDGRIVMREPKVAPQEQEVTPAQ